MQSSALALAMAVALLAGSACSGGRISAGASIPPATTGYVAAETSPRPVRVALPVDASSAHFGEKIAGTGWGCRSDPWHGSGPETLAPELERELRASRIFREVVPAADPSALVLETQIRAWCGRSVGFFYVRIVGVTSLHFTLKDGGGVLFDRTIERVVTDADEAYTGSQVTLVEHAKKILISDSLREVMRELLPALDQAAGASSPP